MKAVGGFVFKMKNASLRNVSNYLQLGTITPVDVLDFCYDRALYGETALKLNCFTVLADYEDLRKEALESGHRYIAGERLSAIDGIPISLKANLSW